MGPKKKKTKPARKRIKKSKTKIIPIDNFPKSLKEFVENKNCRGFSMDFHKDKRGTVVIANGKVYDLVPSSLTFDDLVQMDPLERPHARHLNYTKERTPLEQEKKNSEEHDIHEIGERHGLWNSKKGKRKITSVKKAIKEGADVSQEVKKLLAEKKTCKSKSRLGQIRKQLRKLDYKRYV